MTAQSERRTGRKLKLRWYILGPLTAAVSLSLLLFVCAVLLSREILPFELMEELVIAAVFLAATAGGAAAARGRGGKVMQAGLLSGGVLAAVIVIGTLALPGEGLLSAQCLRHVIAALSGGAFGGALSIKRGGRKGKRRKRK